MPYAHQPRRQRRGGEEESVVLDRPIRPTNAEKEERLRARLLNNNWCDCCGGCVVMPKAKECLCCREVDGAQCKMYEAEISCITKHRCFPMICLEEEVLYSTMVGMQEFAGKTLPNPVPPR